MEGTPEQSVAGDDPRCPGAAVASSAKSHGRREPKDGTTTTKTRTTGTTTGAVARGGNEPGETRQQQQQSHQASSSQRSRSTALNGQLRLLLLVRCLRAAHLAQPLLVPYYSRTLGLEPTRVLWLGSLYSTLVTLAELPSGIASDRLGRKKTLHIAFLGFSGSLLLTALASRFAGGRWQTTAGEGATATATGVLACLGLAQCSKAVGSSMYSGTDSAFLYEMLEHHHRCDERASNSEGNNKSNSESKTRALLLAIESRSVVYTTATEACAAALGGWLCSSSSSSYSSGTGSAGDHRGNKGLELEAVVALSAVPFLVGAFVTLWGLDEPIKEPSSFGGCARARACASAHGTSIETDRRKPRSEAEPARTRPETRASHQRRDLADGSARRTSYLTLPSVESVGWRLFGFFRKGEKDPRRTNREQHRSVILLLSEYVPERLWTLFGVGVALNCGTYLAATAMNPLLWETVGIPVGHFGALHGLCGATAAFGAFLAPTLRKHLVSNNGNGSRHKNANANNQTKSNGTEALLFLMLGSSAAGYGLLALSTGLHRRRAGEAAATTETVPSSHSVSAIGCAIAAALLLSLVRGLAWPVLGSAINASVERNRSRATTLSLFSGAVKIGMVMTGMVMGVLFKESSTLDDPTINSVEKGLLHGSLLCGTALLSVAFWLAGYGLSAPCDEETKNDTPKLKSC
ncbi:unnamed protein product [Pseudo-nitzschia multistriata]|uniref:Major facilitator superfamily (MFS) profile domain-containing protein n=1 Tax=Pseudo-nitzschia multistriata TaxID=183589 RepID=A0A448ZQT7_9STRA|nr:unnamed protein product [Pseudo-nitzschia multistriata]